MNSSHPQAQSPHIAVAPMLDITTGPMRVLLRLISPHVELYTEMITSAALLHGNSTRLLSHTPLEEPLVLQLGGSDPEDLAKCAVLASQWGYHAINLNIGCPSDRVQAGRIGACLMDEPELVADGVRAMREASPLPVTIKTRLGIDKKDDYGYLANFVQTTQEVGCDTYIIHARTAWLKGLSPKQNRDVPPLNYPRVYQLKQDFPALRILINGGIDSLDAIDTHLAHTDGVMIGRAIANNPYWLATLEEKYFGNSTCLSREALLHAYQQYCEEMLEANTPLSYLIRPVFNLFHGQANSRRYRRYLSENLPKASDASLLGKVLMDCLEH